MRVAAGVLLIIMAVVNLFGGLAYAGFGGLAGVGGEYVEQAAQQAALEEQDESSRQANENVGKAAGEAKSKGGIFMIFGIFVLVLGALEIAAAVLLFMAKNAMFVNVVAVLQVIGSLSRFGLIGVGIFSVFGIIVAIFAFLGARSIGQAASSTQPSGFEQ